jgi:DNA processing protein
MSNQERNYYLFFSNFPGVGPVKFKKILAHFGSAKKAYEANPDEFGEIAGKALGKKFENFRNEFDFESYLDKLKKQKIEFICLIDKEYPELLKKIPNPPMVLYLKGNSKLFHSNVLRNARMIAVVGTRHITHYGREITKMFAGELARSGLIIVSGMAYGVDGVAHKACLDVGGKTIAILGNGVDMAYPRENAKLYEEILDGSGLIISELPPGTPPSVGSFPSRNRIVAGLSQAVLVTEGASDSGSLITANFGLEFGRKVFAIPGPITSSLSAAPLRLIEKGAKLVVSPEDVIKELGLKINELGTKKVYLGLSKEEEKIVKLLENESLSFDEIVRALKLDSSKVASILTMMEIKGIIKNSEGGYSITV